MVGGVVVVVIKKIGVWAIFLPLQNWRRERVTHNRELCANG